MHPNSNTKHTYQNNTIDHIENSDKDNTGTYNSNSNSEERYDNSLKLNFEHDIGLNTYLHDTFTLYHASMTDDVTADVKHPIEFHDEFESPYNYNSSEGYCLNYSEVSSPTSSIDSNAFNDIYNDSNYDFKDHFDLTTEENLLYLNNDNIRCISSEGSSGPQNEGENTNEEGNKENLEYKDQSFGLDINTVSSDLKTYHYNEKFGSTAENTANARISKEKSHSEKVNPTNTGTKLEHTESLSNEKYNIAINVNKILGKKGTKKIFQECKTTFKFTDQQIQRKEISTYFKGNGRRYWKSKNGPVLSADKHIKPKKYRCEKSRHSDTAKLDTQTDTNKSKEQLSKEDLNYSNKTGKILKCNQTGGNNKNRFVCITCGKGFPRKSNHDSHIRSHLQVKPHVCKFCGKGFARKSDMSRHERSLHLKATFRCFGKCKNKTQKVSSEDCTENKVLSWGCGHLYSRKDGLRKHWKSLQGQICLRGFVEINKLQGTHDSTKDIDKIIEMTKVMDK